MAKRKFREKFVHSKISRNKELVEIIMSLANAKFSYLNVILLV